MYFPRSVEHTVDEGVSKKSKMQSGGFLYNFTLIEKMFLGSSHSIYFQFINFFYFKFVFSFSELKNANRKLVYLRRNWFIQRNLILLQV